MTNQTSRPVVGINGTYYNVEAFLEKHPGGKQVLKNYFGKDATVVFRVYHSMKVLQENMKYLKKVDTYDLKLKPEDKKLLEIHSKLITNGSYNPDVQWIVTKFLVIIGFYVATYFGLSFSLSYYTETNNNFFYYLRFLFAFTLTLAWQQCGLLMHDCMHISITYNRLYDNILGFLVGNVGIGVNSMWWKIEHNEHHIFTNTYDKNTNVVTDPQMTEVSWIQDERLIDFPIYQQGFWQRILIYFQQFTWVPICVFIGRTAIIIDSYHAETSLYQWSGLLFHILFHYSCFLTLFDNWSDSLLWLYAAFCGQGILTLQLLVSHYDKPFEDITHVMHNSWFVRQSRAVKDIVNPIWMDWFFGGLNFHLVHHSLPKLPRRKVREVDMILRKELKKFNIEIDRVPFFTAIFDCIRHLGQVSIQYGSWQMVLESMRTIG